MRSKLSVILCSQGHLPSGTCEAGFEALYSREIKPLISSLEKFPRVNMVFHYSGVLLNWIERRHPEFFMLLEDVFSRKQAEFLGGGFYNPALPLLPLADKIGQIEMLTTYLRKNFGKRPNGCWLSSMAWEQNIVGPLASCGMSYTFLDEQQFHRSGIKPDATGIFSPCITEDQGKIITIFPIARTLSKELKMGKSLNLLEDLAQASSKKHMQGRNNKVVVFSIGEGTRSLAENTESETKYEELFARLNEAETLVDFITPSKIIKSLRGLEKHYFPCQWIDKPVLGAEIHPRQFLSNHPEASSIYAKTIYVHSLINNQLRGDKTRKSTALEELWKAQDSGIYCLGSAHFCGLSHSPVRKAAYRALLEAEKITREKIKFTPSLSVFDYNLDGEGEYILQDDKLNCYIESRGGGIFELDYLPSAWNYLDTMAPIDSNKRRSAFVDWLAPSDIIPEDIGSEDIKGGRFCGDEEYEIIEPDRIHRKATFKLPPKPGLLWEAIEIEKSWQLKKNTLILDYVLRNTGANLENFVFCLSLDLSFPGEGKEFLRILSVKENEKEPVSFEEAQTLENIKVLEFQDLKNETIIYFEMSRISNIKIFNVYSGLPNKEEYQSTCIIPFLPVSLEAGKTYKTGFSLKISS